jgi:hypothetical protein
VLATIAVSSASVSAKQGYARGRDNGPSYFAMSGTYQLEATRGDDPQRAADRATRDLPRWQRDRAYQSLLARLEPPRMVSIDRDRNGRTFTIASSSGPRTAFEIDRGEWRERGSRGRDIVTHVEYRTDRLSIWTIGDRETDFHVTFQAVDRGDMLFVTRRLDSDSLRDPVTIRSYYRRIGREPRWDLYVPVRYDSRPRGGYGSGSGSGYGVPEGTRLVAVLDTPLSTRSARGGERFSMTVRNPGEFGSAIVYGSVEQVRPTGRGHAAEMRLVFDRIRLRNGRESEFDAVIQEVRTPGGAAMRVDSSSGEVEDKSKTVDTIEKGAVGAALGAVVGAILGGGKGAAIGAAVGGAGGVIAGQARDEFLDLPAGTQVTMVVASTTRGHRP